MGWDQSYCKCFMCSQLETFNQRGSLFHGLQIDLPETAYTCFITSGQRSIEIEFILWLAIWESGPSNRVAAFWLIRYQFMDREHSSFSIYARTEELGMNCFLSINIQHKSSAVEHPTFAALRLVLLPVLFSVLLSQWMTHYSISLDVIVPVLLDDMRLCCRLVLILCEWVSEHTRMCVMNEYTRFLRLHRWGIH